MPEQTRWLERQYWEDVVAVRPDTRIEEQIRQSNRIRAQHAETIDLRYGSDERQRLDLFLPDGEGPWPLLAFVHGGYWQLGCKDDWAFIAPGWLERGVAFATFGYRLAPKAQLPDVAADILAALRYLDEHAADVHVDTQRVVLSGISAGAHLTAMAITATATAINPAAAVLLSGVYDLRPLEATTPGAALRNSLSLDLAEISPLGRRPPDGCRCLISWGQDETDVFHSQSQLLGAFWANWGTTAELLERPDTNHYTIVDCLLGDSGGPVSDFIVSVTGSRGLRP